MLEKMLPSLRPPFHGASSQHPPCARVDTRCWDAATNTTEALPSPGSPLRVGRCQFATLSLVDALQGSFTPDAPKNHLTSPFLCANVTPHPQILNQCHHSGSKSGTEASRRFTEEQTTHPP